MRPPTGLLVCALIAVCMEAAAVSPDPHAADVDAVFAELDSTHRPGCAAGVIRDGAIAYANGYGMANLDYSEPITPGTVFDIGSTSKQFTAAAVALLALDGRLSLDDDIRRFIPELPAYESVITVRHLLHHTSGIRDYLTLMSLAGMDDHDDYSYRELVDLLARQHHLNFTPGDEHLYSNSGYVLLAVIVERVTGERFGEFLEQRIFEPLGMDSSFVYEDRGRIVPGRATGYSLDENGELQVDHYWNFLLGGDGQVYTTVHDLARWERNFDHPEVGGDALLEILLERGTLNDGEAIDYALGLVHGSYRGLETVRHGGAWGGFRAELVRVPDHRFSVAVLCNSGNTSPGELANRVVDIYLAEHLAPEEVQPDSETAALDPAVLAACAGQYLLDAGILLTVVEDEDRLWMEAEGMPRMELRPVSESEFVADGLGARVSFLPAEAGPMAGLVIHAGEDEIAGSRIDPYEPTARQLEEASGEYVSDELGVTYRLVVKDGAMVLELGSASEHAVQFIAEDSFVTERFSGTLTRGGDGGITGMMVDAGRVKGLRFARQ